MGPVWWYTTRVPRTSLRLQLDVVPSKWTRFSKFAVVLVSDEPKAPNVHAHLSKFLGTTQKFEWQGEFHEKIECQLREHYLEEDSLDRADSPEDLPSLLQSIEHPQSEQLALFIIDGQKLQFLEYAHIFACPQGIVYVTTRAISIHELESVLKEVMSLLRPQDNRNLIMTKAARSPSYLVTVSLVIADNNDPHQLVSSWTIQSAIQQSLLPLVQELSQIAEIRLHTQVRHLAPTTHITTHYQNSMHFLNDSAMSCFVDDNGWNLESSISQSIPIHFVVFVPPNNLQPLRTHEGGLFFAYQQWGGVFLLNMFSDSENPIQITDHDLRPAMEHFAGQLRRFFNVDLTSAHGTQIVGGEQSQPLTNFELHRLCCHRLTANIEATISTLSALSQLVIENSQIAIPSEVSSLLVAVGTAIKDSRSSLANGRISDAHKFSLFALQYGEAAFFHPSMMAQQYFPQEHKLGVYLPLLFPFVLPVLLSTARLVIPSI